MNAQRSRFIRWILVGCLICLLLSVHAYASEHSFFLSSLTYESDIFLSKQELLQMTGLQESSSITQTHIKQAYKNVQRKGRFSSITFYPRKTDVGIQLHIALVAGWVLKKVVFKGFFFGKNEYELLYRQQQGTLFDSTLHEESIEAIRKRLHDHGLFGSTVDDEIFYDKKQKTVTVIVNISLGRQYRVSAVSFSCAHHTDDEVLQAAALEKKFSPLLIATGYKKKRLKKIIRKLKQHLQAHGYYHVRVQLTKVPDHVQKTVALMCMLHCSKPKKISFEGHSVFSADELKNTIIDVQSPDWLFAPAIIKEQITYEYYKKGYWSCQVTHQLRDDFHHFIIHEQQPVIVNDVEVCTVEGKSILDIPFFWRELIEHRILDQGLLDRGLSRLQRFYEQHGFWDFVLHETRYIKNTTTGMYNVVVSINPGKQYFVGKISVEHDTMLDLDQAVQVAAQVGDNFVPFNKQLLEDQQRELLRVLQNNAYWYAAVRPKVTIEELPADNNGQQRTRASVVWEVLAGEQVTVGPLILQGYTQLPYERIIKKIGFKRGDVWHKDHLERARKKLKDMGMFKQIHVQPQDLFERTSQKPILLTLVDDDPYEVMLRGGYFLTSKNFLFRRQSTPKIGGSFLLKNTTNRADSLRFDVNLTKFERTILGTYQQPYPFDLPLTVKLSGYTNKYVNPVRVASSTAAYEAEEHGLLIGVSNEFKDGYYWAVTVGNEWMKTSRVRGDLKLNSDLIDRLVPYCFIEPSLVLDRFDDRLNPTRGYTTFCSLKMMIPESVGVVTARFLVEQAWVKPITSWLIGAVRVRFGHIFRRAFDRIEPIERFFLGGPQSVRGYQKDALPPLGMTVREEGTATIKEYTIQGGSSMINTNLELRFPLIKQLGGVIFQDTGVLSQTGLPGLAGRWLPTAGVGLRYKTPIGPLRFDIGWKLKPAHDGDVPYAWYLTLGEVF